MAIKSLVRINANPIIETFTDPIAISGRSCRSSCQILMSGLTLLRNIANIDSGLPGIFNDTTRTP